MPVRYNIVAQVVTGDTPLLWMVIKALPTTTSILIGVGEETVMDITIYQT